jgi:flagellar hook assembly protein FlgD
VIKSEKFIVDEVSNYPNPFTAGTSFVFTHNQSEGRLDVSLRIYSLDGQSVRTFETSFYPTGYRSEPIYWDGNAEPGYPSAGGIYIYRIVVKNEAAQTDTKSGKLILIK